jgi:hypothetical protein
MSSTVAGADELDESDESDELVRIETNWGLAVCRGCGPDDPDGDCDDPLSMEPLAAPAYKNTSSGTCYNEDGVIKWIASKHPRPAPDPITRKPWGAPAELLARIPAREPREFPAREMVRLMKARLWRAARDCFEEHIEFARSVTTDYDDVCMLMMIGCGMEEEAHRWFRQTIMQRTEFKILVIQRLHAEGWTNEAKQLFQKTYENVTTYEDSHVWILRGMFNAENDNQATRLFNHMYHFGKPEDQAAATKTYYMLNEREFYVLMRAASENAP